MKNVSYLLLVLISFFSSLDSHAFSLTDSLDNTNPLKRKDYSTKLHVSATFNYGDFRYTNAIQKALIESDYSKQVIKYPDYDVNNFIIDLFTLGLFSNNQQSTPIVSYEKPSFSTTSSVFKIEIAYNIKPNVQVGGSYIGYSSSTDVVRNSDHSCLLNVNTKVSAVSTFFMWDFTPYKRNSKLGLGIKAGGGFNGNFFKENQNIFSYKNNVFANSDYSSAKFQLGILFASKLELFLGKNFSIVLADIMMNLPINRAVIDQSNDVNNNLILKSHHVNTCYFTYGFGVGVHF